MGTGIFVKEANLLSDDEIEIVNSNGSRSRFSLAPASGMHLFNGVLQCLGLDPYGATDTDQLVGREYRFSSRLVA